MSEIYKRYFNFRLRKIVTVDELVTLETLEVGEGYVYPEEAHDFFELAYVEDGRLAVHCGDEVCTLYTGELYLIRPLDMHHYECADDKPGKITVICFTCRSELLEPVLGRNVLNAEARQLMARLLSEAKSAFVFPFDRKMQLLDNPKLGAQQLVEMYIEELLVGLIRNRAGVDGDIRPVSSNEELESRLVESINALLRDNLCNRITLDDVCQRLFYSKTYLNSLYKRRMGHSIMQYYNILKIEEAKKLLLQGETTTLISDRLEYDNPAYFVKVFKRLVHMTPKEFKRSEIDSRRIPPKPDGK